MKNNVHISGLYVLPLLGNELGSLGISYHETSELWIALKILMLDSHPRVGAAVGKKSYLIFHAPFLLSLQKWGFRSWLKWPALHFLIQRTFLPPRLGKALRHLALCCYWLLLEYLPLLEDRDLHTAILEYRTFSNIWWMRSGWGDLCYPAFPHVYNVTYR